MWWWRVSVSLTAGYVVNRCSEPHVRFGNAGSLVVTNQGILRAPARLGLNYLNSTTPAPSCVLHGARPFTIRVNILDRIQKRHLYPPKPLFNGLQNTRWVLSPFLVTSGPIDRDGPKAHDLQTLPPWNFIPIIDRNAHNYPVPTGTSKQFPQGRKQHPKGP